MRRVRAEFIEGDVIKHRVSRPQRPFLHVLSLVLLLAAGAAQGQVDWERRSDLAPATGHHAGGVIDGRLYV
ncbi:MAG: hypothetical protein AAF533_19985, partial [Acidobacteriota bacterium]